MKAAVIGLLAVLLTGCDSHPANERLEMDLAKIEALCARVALKEQTVARDVAPKAAETFGDLAYNRIYDAAAAECELEYRIKQQEANKRF